MPPVTDLSNDVSYPLDAYRSMSPYWSKINALKGGTEAMRSSGKEFLPKEEAESQRAYDVRLNKTFLYEAYTDTIRKILSKPFSRKIAISGFEKEDDYKKYLRIQADVDRSGKNIDAWSEEVFEAAIDYGLTHILIDYPTLPVNANLEDEKTVGNRPTWVHVPPPSLIGWRYSGLGDNAVLNQIRIFESRMEPDGDFGEKAIDYIRVITPRDFQLYSRAEGGGWTALYVDDDGNEQPQPHTFGAIPLVTVYFNRTGFMTGKPAMNGLANLNIEHWQSSSDQRTVLTMARFGILFGRGFDEEQVKTGLEVGPKRIITTSNPDADLKFVEHTGAAIQSGERDLEQLQLRMEVMGLQPFVKQGAVETATSKLVNESKTESAIHTWITRMEAAIVQCFEYSAKWLKIDLPESLQVDIFSDFGITLGATDDMRLLLDMWAAGAINLETFLKEVRRRGLVDETTDINAVIASVSEELNLSDLTGKKEDADKQ